MNGKRVRRNDRSRVPRGGRHTGSGPARSARAAGQIQPGGHAQEHRRPQDTIRFEAAAARLRCCGAAGSGLEVAPCLGVALRLQVAPAFPVGFGGPGRAGGGALPGWPRLGARLRRYALVLALRTGRDSLLLGGPVRKDQPLSAFGARTLDGQWADQRVQAALGEVHRLGDLIHALPRPPVQFVGSIREFLVVAFVGCHWTNPRSGRPEATKLAGA